MGTRREQVDIRARSNIAALAAKDSVAVRGLANSVDSLSRSAVQSDRASQRMADGGLQRIGTSAQTTTRQVRDADRGLNDFTGRLRAVGQVALTLGPALLPVAAIGVPAIAGVAAQLAVAGAAGATAILAFNGVGEALTTIEAARLDPTAENLEKMRDTLAELSPQARQFAREFGALRPELEAATVDAAASGFFPGLMRGLDDLESALPSVESFFKELGDITGDLAGDSLESLTSDRWQGFFDYIQTRGRPLLTDLVGTVGDVTHGFAELVQAADPLSMDFSSWLRGAAADFDNWAAGLAKTEGFREFVQYVRTSGPQVADAAGAIGGALVDVAKAAAPLGGPALGALEGIANAFSAIASSPIGTPLLQAASALILFNRAAAATKAVSGVFATTRTNAASASGSVVGGMGRAATAIGLATGAATMFGNKLAEWTGAKADIGGVADDLASLADGGKPDLLYQLGDSLEHVGTRWNQWAEVAREPLSLFGFAGDTSFDVHQKNIEAVDQALADLIETGQRGQAEKAFQSILEEATGALPGASIAPWARDDVLENFPEYQAALDAAVGGNGRYANSADEAGDAAGGASQSIGEMSRAMRRQHSAALGAFDAQTQWGQALADARVAADKGARGINSHTAAGRENRGMLSTLASSWNGMSNAVKQNTGRYYNARDAFVRVATAMTGNEAQAKRLARRYLDMPKKVLTRLALEGERDTMRGLNNTTKRVERLDRQRARPRVEPQTRRGDQTLSRFDSRMREIGGRRPVPVIGANDKPGRSTVQGMDNRLRQLDRQKTTPGVGADVGEAMRKTGQAREELNRFGNLRPSPRVGITDAASGPLSGIRALLGSIQSKTVTVTVQTRNVRANAAGGYYPAGTQVQTYAARAAANTFSAAGDNANAHMPQIATGGVTRVWGEDETKGESYIPHANDWRRPRARSIAEETVAILGGEVEWYARGGMHRRRGTDARLVDQHDYDNQFGGLSGYMARERAGVEAAMRSGGGSHGFAPRVSIGGNLRLSGTLDTPWGPAKMRSMVVDVVDNRIQDHRAADEFRDFAESTRIHDGSGVEGW